MKLFNGHVHPWWDEEFKSLPYETRPFTDPETLNIWQQQYGYNKLNFGGNVFDMSNTMPSFSKNFFTLMPWNNVSITFFQMVTNDILPIHVDKYSKYKRVYNILDTSTIFRCIVFLEDWKSGHYLEVNNIPVLPWKKGDYVYWNNDTPHFAGNFGIEPRYTLQITGTYVQN